MQDDIPRPYTILDGAAATNLFAAGMPREGVLYEEWILSHKEVLLSLQTDFVNAGASVLYTPTLTANEASLIRRGVEAPDVDSLNKSLAALTITAAAGKAKVAGCLGPTGLALAPAGETEFDELCQIYAEQAGALDEVGVDLFVIETMVSVPEARAAVLACRKYKKPVMVSMALNDDGELIAGGDPLACLISMQALGVDAFGFNCGKSPAVMEEALRAIAPYASVPLLAKPSAGEPNPILPDQYEISPVMLAKACEKLMDAGASIVGGCCGTTPEHIRAIAEMTKTYEKKPLPKLTTEQENDIWLTNERSLFALDEERIEFTAPLNCGYDMSDDFLTAENDSYDVMLIRVETPDDALDFAHNAPFAALPVCFQSDDPEALSRALFLYSGRAMVDSNCELEDAQLQKIAARYGAFVY